MKIISIIIIVLFSLFSCNACSCKTDKGSPQSDTTGIDDSDFMAAINLDLHMHRDTSHAGKRHYYFSWSYWSEKASGWGENDIWLNHYPTKKEVLEKYVYPLNKNYKNGKFTVDIHEVTDEELHEILSPDNLINKAQQAHYKSVYH